MSNSDIDSTESMEVDLSMDISVDLSMDVSMDHLTNGEEGRLPSCLAVDTRPRSIAECYVNNIFVPNRFVDMQCRLHEEMNNKRQQLLAEWDAVDATLLHDAQQLAAKQKKTRVRQPMTCINADGQRVLYTYRMSTWYMMYVDRPRFTPKFHRKFRRRFRMPYDSYLEILEMVKSDCRFRRWTSELACKRDSSPVSLLLLGTLRYLGRGWTFDDLDEATGIGEETHRKFFHAFLDFGSTALVERYILAPSTPAEAEDSAREYAWAGFHGAIGSTDATHVLCDRIPHSIAQLHIAHKMKNTARSYNLTCNHRRHILGTTRGFPARWNSYWRY